MKTKKGSEAQTTALIVMVRHTPDESPEQVKDRVWKLLKDSGIEFAIAIAPPEAF